VSERLVAGPGPEERCEGLSGVLIRYADDFVGLCRSRQQAEHALVEAGIVLAGLGLELHADKTKVVDLGEGRQGVDFLGCLPSVDGLEYISDNPRLGFSTLPAWVFGFRLGLR